MLMHPHVYAPPPKRHSLRFQAQPLLNRMISAEFDFPARAHNPVPRHVK